jgi:arsenate reductase
MTRAALLLCLAPLFAPASTTLAGGASVPTQGTQGHTMDTRDLYPEIGAYLSTRAGEFGQIPADRRADLEAIAASVRAQIDAAHPVRMLFVCTHNSRRSHMGQLWAAAAAEAYGIDATTYSGGTEDTAFNPRAVASMRRAGLRIEQTTDDRNPVYHARIGDGLPVMTCFSKAYDNPPNPRGGFIAVMVCAEADEACPNVEGAADRFALPFVDPKVSDGTPAEAVTYDERSAQIAREMLYIMSRVRG